MMIYHHRLSCRTPKREPFWVDIQTTGNSLLSLVKSEKTERILCFTYVDEFGKSFVQFKCNGASLGIISPLRKRVKAIILTVTRVSWERGGEVDDN